MQASDAGTPARIARQLSRLVGLRVPLAPALRALVASGELGRAFEAAAARAAEGAPLADALRAAGGPLSSSAFASLIESGEKAQALEHALDEVASLATRIELARRRLRSALAYPTLIAVFAVALSAIFVTIAGEPTRALVRYIESCDKTPPFLIATMGWASQRLALVWGGAVAAFLLLAFVRRAMLADRAPRLGAVLGGRVRAALALRALGTLVGQGVPSPRAWAIVTATLDLGSTGVEDGAEIARVVADHGLVTRAESLGLLAAARAGQKPLALALEEAASEQEAAIERSVARFTMALEPAVELAFGVLVLLAGLTFIPLTGGLG